MRNRCPLVSIEDKDRIGTGWTKGADEECNKQPPIFLGADVDKRTQRMHAATGFRMRQRCHMRRPAELHGRMLYDTPTIRGDLHRFPMAIGEIEVDRVIESSDTKMHRQLTSIEERYAFHGSQGIVYPRL